MIKSSPEIIITVIIWMSAGADLIFYLSEGALIWEGWWSFKPGQSLNFSAVKRGAHLKGAFIKAGAIFQIIMVMLPGLKMSYLNAFMPVSNCSRTYFISHSKFVWTVSIPGTQRKGIKICQSYSYKHLLWQQKKVKHWLCYER